MRKLLTIGFLFITTILFAQKKWSMELANTAMKIWPDSFLLENDKTAKWRYDQGVILKGIEGIWNATGNGKWFAYIRKSMDHYVQPDGTIRGYRPDEYNIDHVNNGKLLLLLYRVTQKEKYFKAAQLLREQLRRHPRTSEGGFWHKNIYPWQMWLDGLYMGQPFYAEYAKLFHEDSAFNDIARQFILMEKHARDPKTGLLYHGWDESRQQKWADKKTGLSPNFWGRALGWYGMAMVDALDHFPEKHPGKDSIIAILNRFAKAITAVQDPATGLWYDVVDKKNEPENYFEASASSMLVYTLAKGVRLGYLPANYKANAKKGYDGIIKKFIKEENGQVNLHGTVAVSGLGGNPYRDGSFEYYMSEPVIVNDPKGMGAFIKCAVEMEMMEEPKPGKGKTVLLDTYFNNEWKKDVTGNMIRWHYTWDDKSNSGFAMLGDVFKKYGAKIAELEKAPTNVLLQNASVYIIADPDHLKDNPQPNYISMADVKAISDWVKAGGTLLLMANDSANCDLDHFNKLASVFGITFTSKNLNMVKNDQYEQGIIQAGNQNPVLRSTGKMYLKEISSLNIKAPARVLVKKDTDVIMATAVYGKGKVFAVGDPWLYNEYVDGRKLPAEYENYKAAEDLVQWLLGNSLKK